VVSFEHPSIKITEDHSKKKTKSVELTRFLHTAFNTEQTTLRRGGVVTRVHSSPRAFVVRPTGTGTYGYERHRGLGDRAAKGTNSGTPPELTAKKILRRSSGTLKSGESNGEWPKTEGWKGGFPVFPETI